VLDDGFHNLPLIIFLRPFFHVFAILSTPS
jgi:hypothetical protein